MKNKIFSYTIIIVVVIALVVAALLVCRLAALHHQQAVCCDGTLTTELNWHDVVMEIPSVSLKALFAVALTLFIRLFVSTITAVIAVRDSYAGRIHRRHGSPADFNIILLLFQRGILHPKVL